MKILYKKFAPLMGEKWLHKAVNLDFPGVIFAVSYY